MEALPSFKNFTQVADQEIMHSGHVACPGCGAALAMRLALKTLGRDTMIIFPACCWAVIDGPFPYSASGVPVFQTAFETAAITAGAIRAGLDATGRRGKTNVMAWAGDGGTMDIGFGQLSAAAERNDNIIYVCYDNEAYMNTGIQRSSATPWGAWTTTTPGKDYKKEQKKNLMEIMAAHRIPYAASTTVAYPDDLVSKFRRAMSIEGFRLIHIFSPCPPGHKSLEKNSIKIARYAVESRVFPMYEVFDGTHYNLSMDPPVRPVDDYMVLQGRFKHLGPEKRELIQRHVDEEWSRLMHFMKIGEAIEADHS
ncbi:MAG: thiamine pyrophosphate-dependent enzyme [Candidatus Electryoneaceae bacterium]|nr:thiamine pyrophosphate-dependent enzyme [Candidatus Electryoneaceae bacterium]